MVKVLAFTGAPSRVPRVEQYITPLRHFGIELTESSSRAGSFPPEKYWARPAWALWNLAEHATSFVRSYNYDLTLLQREMLSTAVTFEPFTKRPRVLDVDDAIWAYRGGAFARRLARICDHVICGNNFLAEQFSQWNPNVSVLPTAIDTVDFTPPDRRPSQRNPVIGWLGLAAGYSVLYSITPALRAVLRRHPEVRLRVVSNKPPEFSDLPAAQVEYVPYSREHHVSQVQAMTIGIMPLVDSVVCRGKCSFKMLQYMACGVPVVVSSIGMNKEILAQGEAGFGVNQLRDWEESLETLLKDPEMAARMGATGRSMVELYYSVSALTPRLAATLLTVARGRSPQSVSVEGRA